MAEERGREDLAGLKAADVMKSPVVSVGPKAPVADILRAFREHSIGGVLVLEEGRLVGIVTEGDIVRTIAEREPHLAFPSFFDLMGPVVLWDPPVLRDKVEELRRLRAEDIMTRRVATVRPDTPLTDVAAMLMRLRIKRVPVVDERGRVLGVVARGDIVRRLGELAASGSPSE